MNLSSVRRVKSSQGSRRGTCGWITSFSFLFISFSYGLLAQPGRALALHARGFGFEQHRYNLCVESPEESITLIKHIKNTIFTTFTFTSLITFTDNRDCSCTSPYVDNRTRVLLFRRSLDESVHKNRLLTTPNGSPTPLDG